jgi:large subunit ribosomal protein L17
MRHARTGSKLGRTPAHRKALYANLAGAVLEHGRIKTTITKAKAVKPIAEQLITLGRRGDMHARRQAVAFLRSKHIVHRLFTEVGPAFADRPGGYLRITRIGPRPGDAAELAYLELVDTPLVFKSSLRDDEPEYDEPVAAAVAEDEDTDVEELDDDLDEDDEGAEDEDVAEDEDESEEPEDAAGEPAAGGEGETAEPGADASEGEKPSS